MTRDELPYAAFWCEENVWQLCGHEAFAGLERYAVIVSSRCGRVATWMQRAAPRPEWPVLWDYHVVLLVRAASAWVIWDLDSTLGCPVAAEGWLACSFLPLRPEHLEFAPVFRVVAADEYRSTFSSDRSHMRDESGALQVPPPAWPAIVQGPSNLARWIDIRDPFVGRVMDLEQLQTWLGEARPDA